MGLNSNRVVSMKVSIVIMVLSIIGNLTGSMMSYIYHKTDGPRAGMIKSLIRTRPNYKKRFSKYLLFIHYFAVENLLYNNNFNDGFVSQGIEMHSATYLV